MVLSCCNTQERAPIPKEVMFEQVSPSGDVTAVIYTADTGKTDWIGSEHRAYLAILIQGNNQFTGFIETCREQMALH